MKKIVAFALVCLTLLSVGLPVFADVIYEPPNWFFGKHQDECVYNHNRQYVVNTEEGHAYLYYSPETSRTIDGYANGTQWSISHLYTDANGQTWGIILSGEGWFRMDDLTVIYDSFSFVEEHER